jgi:hypothetical protein
MLVNKSLSQKSKKWMVLKNQQQPKWRKSKKKSKMLLLFVRKNQ